MIYLIGVDHMIQINNDRTPIKKQTIQRFRNYLNEKIKSLQITLLAEEFNEDALRGNSVEESNLQAIARDAGIEHKFCDPGIEERRILGIDNDNQKRECEWLKRITDSTDLKESNVIFLCGSTHLQSFKTLVRESGFQVKIIYDGWGAELNSSEHFLQYPE